MTVVRNFLLEALSVFAGEMQEEQYGKNIPYPVIPTQRMLTKRKHRIKKLNINFCLALHILFSFSKQADINIFHTYVIHMEYIYDIYKDISEVLGRAVG